MNRRTFFAAPIALVVPVATEAPKVIHHFSYSTGVAALVAQQVHEMRIELTTIAKRAIVEDRNRRGID